MHAPAPLLAALLLLGACASTPEVVVEERPAAAPAPLERLRFAWPDALRLAVSRQARRAETVAGKVQRSQGPVERWRWSFHRQGEHARLRMEPTGREEREVWDFELAADGSVSRVDGLEGADREALLQLWAQLVGLWRERELELGQAYRRSAEDGEGPGLQLVARKAAACPGAGGEGAPQCVWLESLFELEERRFKDLGQAAVSDFLSGLDEVLPELSELPVEIVSVRPERQTELIAEPDTLLPHAFVERTYLRLELRAGDAPEPIVSEVVEEVRWSFERAR
ncbi:MAG: hypothetical protein P1V51_25030 [Deltaproteobacteria bacterium]|nr:hypothetical protein [Deltaproteobacteria bacterium]